MMPLWAIASRPLQSVWGWALRSTGGPWVAQRVWPMPTLAPAGASPTAAASSASFPERRRRHTSPSACRATPAES